MLKKFKNRTTKIENYTTFLPSKSCSFKSIKGNLVKILFELAQLRDDCSSPVTDVVLLIPKRVIKAIRPKKSINYKISLCRITRYYPLTKLTDRG